MAARVPVPPGASAPDPRVRAAAGGDRAAAEALLGELLPRARNLIRYLVRGDGEVDDIAQESLIAILRGLPSYRGEGAFTAWADRVTVRVTFAHLGRVRADRARNAGDGAHLHLVPDPDGSPDDYAVRRETARLLDRLPADQRHALVLHHVLGMSVPEIAGELALPFDTVKSRLRIGMDKLRALHESLRTQQGDGEA